MSLSVVVKPQAMWPFWPSRTSGAPGAVAPEIVISGVVMRARYHRIGMFSSRWGSLASSGLPVVLRVPSITHSFDAPAPTLGSASSRSSIASFASGR